MTAKEMTFLQSVVLAAQQSQKACGIPASVTIAQAILESGWGQSKLAQEANNFFGVKAKQGEDYAEFSTTEFLNGRKKEVMARFARYSSPVESFRAHAALLSTLPRYKPAMACAHDPGAFAKQIQLCGYSTNPSYAESLIAVIRAFDLTQYDIQPVPPATKEKAA